MTARNSSGGEIDIVQERSGRLRRKTPRRFMARTDGNSFVDVAAFVDDNASPGDSLSFRRRRRRRGMRLPRLLTCDDTYILVYAHKSSSSVFSFRALRPVANTHISCICRQAYRFLTQSRQSAKNAKRIIICKLKLMRKRDHRNKRTS